MHNPYFKLRGLAPLNYSNAPTPEPFVSADPLTSLVITDDGCEDIRDINRETHEHRADKTDRK